MLSKQTIHTTDLATEFATELQELEGALRQVSVGKAVLLVLDPVLLLTALAAVEGDSALGALESAILEARARSTTNGLRRWHLEIGVSLQCRCVWKEDGGW